MRNDGKASTTTIGLAWGMCEELLLTIIGSAIIAVLVLEGKMSEENIGYGIMLVLLAVSYAGAAFSAARIKRRKIMVCGISGLLYWLMLMLITLLFFGGQFGTVWAPIFLIFAGSMAAAIVPGRGERGQPKRKKKKQR